MILEKIKQEEVHISHIFLSSIKFVNDEICTVKSALKFQIVSHQLPCHITDILYSVLYSLLNTISIFLSFLVSYFNKHLVIISFLLHLPPSGAATLATVKRHHTRYRQLPPHSPLSGAAKLATIRRRHTRHRQAPPHSLPSGTATLAIVRRRHTRHR